MINSCPEQDNESQEREPFCAFFKNYFLVVGIVIISPFEIPEPFNNMRIMELENDAPLKMRFTLLSIKFRNSRSTCALFQGVQQVMLLSFDWRISIPFVCFTCSCPLC